jgi:hypothetical protein
MANLRFLDGERVLLESENGLLTVTTHRVRKHATDRGSARIVSMMVESVTSCEVTHDSHPQLLGFAALAVLGGLLLNNSRDNTALVLGLVAAILLAVAYVVTRRQVVRVSSPSAHIDVRLIGMSLEQAVGVVDAVEKAKERRHVQRG